MGKFEVKIISVLFIMYAILIFGNYCTVEVLENKINENNKFIGMIDNRVDDLERNDVRNDLLLLQEKVYEKEIKEAREILKSKYGGGEKFSGIEDDRILFYSFDLDIYLSVDVKNRIILIK